MREIKARILVPASVLLFGFYYWRMMVLFPFGWVSLIALLPAAWVALDSTRIRVRDFHTSLSYRPGVLFLLTAACWVVVLPWYLTVREFIKAGRAPARAAQPTSPPVGPAA